MADVQSGEVDAIVAHTSHRITRKASEMEAFLDLIETTGVSVATVEGHDLGTVDGRMVVRIMTTIDQNETELRSERTKAGLAPFSTPA
ncbi:hypothetical protein ASD10_09595 [Aeromicrobium sp. Root472D3]|nr:hypothetical protein ASD10_09595 [Aeromicrobium sp. Root472D3]